MLSLKEGIGARRVPFGFAHTKIEIELPGEACRDGS